MGRWKVMKLKLHRLTIRKRKANQLKGRGLLLSSKHTNGGCQENPIEAEEQPSVDAAKLLAFSNLICRKFLKKTGLYLARYRRESINLRKKQQVGGADFELCKKKILMGAKCRALTKSGMLHYDENGILLLEETTN